MADLIPKAKEIRSGAHAAADSHARAVAARIAA
jgi:hypothetical protein